MDVLPRVGLVDGSISYYTSADGYQLLGMVKLCERIRQEQYDTLVYLAPARRTRWQVWRDLAFFRLAGINVFIGHKGFVSRPRKRSGIPLPVVEHEADHLLARIALQGIAVPEGGKGSMDLLIQESELSDAKDWLLRQTNGRPHRLFVGIGPSSKMPSKVWPRERFGSLGSALIDEFDIFPIVFGGMEDSEIGDWLIAQWCRGANAAGRLNIRQSAALLSKCDLYVGNDTGTMHLAAAVGTRCVALFSARDLPGAWHPYGEGHYIIRKSVPCEGCRLVECEKEGLKCLMMISVEEVLSLVRQLMGR